MFARSLRASLAAEHRTRRRTWLGLSVSHVLARSAEALEQGRPGAAVGADVVGRHGLADAGVLDRQTTREIRTTMGRLLRSRRGRYPEIRRRTRAVCAGRHKRDRPVTKITPKRVRAIANPQLEFYLATDRDRPGPECCASQRRPAGRAGWRQEAPPPGRSPYDPDPPHRPPRQPR